MLKITKEDINVYKSNGHLIWKEPSFIYVMLYMLNSSYKCNGIHINNLFKFFVWCEVSKSFTRSII